MIEHAFPHQQGLYAPNRERKYLNADERARFLLASRLAPLPVQALCETLVFTGCRVTEALELTSEAILQTEQILIIRSLKKRDRFHLREVPIPTHLTHLLVSATAAHTSQQRVWTMHRAQAWRWVKHAMSDARIDGVRACPRGLRHTFGVHAVRTGVPLNFIQRWMGHADLSTTSIYLDAIGPDERTFASQMWDHPLAMDV